MQSRRQLLQLLSDGEYHSGEALGQAIGVSRMAVWKHINALRKTGVDLQSRHGKGYRLPASVELLDRELIRQAVAPETRAGLESIDIQLDIDSTNNHLRALALQGAPAGSVCLAERQHGGRGRRGRDWVSPFAANLYFSLLWRISAGAMALGGLSLVTGIAVVRSLRCFGIEAAGLKWPNDILANNAKLAGILIDVVGESTGPCAVVIGIGVNVCMPGTAATGIDQAWTDLRTLNGHNDVSRNRLAACLLDQLLPAIAQFEAQGLQPFMEEWQRYDIVQGRPVDLQLPNEVISGVACGIDAGGALLVDTATGRRRFTSGEVSVRFAP
jgi:BirA family transcriptional regulator, biotin operon repressor / biotin---[acetyl-CoA-carboxylase] ligase